WEAKAKFHGYPLSLEWCKRRHGCRTPGCSRGRKRAQGTSGRWQPAPACLSPVRDVLCPSWWSLGMQRHVSHQHPEREATCLAPRLWAPAHTVPSKVTTDGVREPTPVMAHAARRVTEHFHATPYLRDGLRRRQPSR